MPSELLDLARTIALEAGELAAKRRREGVEVAATKSTIVDVVTEADREVERLIRGRILDARPGDAVLGEEGGSSSRAFGRGAARGHAGRVPWRRECWADSTWRLIRRALMPGSSSTPSSAWSRPPPAPTATRASAATASGSTCSTP
jgi:3'-phosphoadenosine 5'-phosphosulfate (PAPS) 3'-phosphatase